MIFKQDTAIRCREHDLCKCFKFLHEQGLEWRNGEGQLLTDGRVFYAIRRDFEQSPDLKYIYFLIYVRHSETILCWSESALDCKVIEFSELDAQPEHDFSIDEYMAVLNSIFKNKGVL